MKWVDENAKASAEDRRKHLDYIQAVVTRLAGNSFSIKTWAVGLIAVLGGLVVKTPDARLALGLLFPVFGFWYLDSYYLQQERIFRKLYEAAINPSIAPAMKVPLFSMKPMKYADPKDDSLLATAMSKTVAGLHGTILIVVLALTLYSLRQESKMSKPDPGVCIPASAASEM